MRRRLVGDEDVGAFVFFVGRKDLLLLVGPLSVDLPRVKVLMAEKVQSGVVVGAAMVTQRFVDVVAVVTVRIDNHDDRNHPAGGLFHAGVLWKQIEGISYYLGLWFAIVEGL